MRWFLDPNEDGADEQTEEEPTTTKESVGRHGEGGRGAKDGDQEKTVSRRRGRGTVRSRSTAVESKPQIAKKREKTAPIATDVLRFASCFDQNTDLIFKLNVINL